MNFFIKEARQKAGLSQIELAKAIGVAQTTLSGYEVGQHDPKSNLLIKIADVCDVSVDYLLGREQQEKEELPDMLSGSLTPQQVEAALISAGFIKPGQDLTDADLKFLISVGGMLRSWFGD